MQNKTKRIIGFFDDELNVDWFWNFLISFHPVNRDAGKVVVINVNHMDFPWPKAKIGIGEKVFSMPFNTLQFGFQMLSEIDLKLIFSLAPLCSFFIHIFNGIDHSKWLLLFGHDRISDFWFGKAFCIHGIKMFFIYFSIKRRHRFVFCLFVMFVCLHMKTERF